MLRYNNCMVKAAKLSFSGDVYVLFSGNADSFT